MVRRRWPIFALLLLAGATGIRAADDGPGGTYKLLVPGNEGHLVPYWIVKLDRMDDKWTGAIVASAEGLPPGASLEDMKVSGDQLGFAIKIQGQRFSFEGKLPKEKDKKILGSMVLGRQMVAVQLEPTKLRKLNDPFELSKEALNAAEGGNEVFDLARDLLRQAAAKEAKPEEVRGWADKAFKTAEAYGPRWQREVALRNAEALRNQDGFATVALEYARRAERLLDAKDDATVQIRVLEALAGALKKADKGDDAKGIDARLEKLEATADQEYLKKTPPLDVEPVKRKGDGDRAVLVELFTGAQCPPCVAADMAFDALEKSYKPTDVILLQYHLHIPGPDPLANTDSEARAKYYEVESTPNILFSGKGGDAGGGSSDEAKATYKEYRGTIDPLLENPAKVKLKAAAIRKGDKINITAEASGIENPGDKVRLRLALVEEKVRYAGGNQMRFHHHVVRALPGGAQGLALTEKTGKQAVTVDLEKVRKDLNEYLTDYAKSPRTQFPSSKRPMEMKKLYVVAFVQNDATKEVLQATEVEVRTEEGGN